MTDIALLLFDGVTALDAIGPYEVLWRIPGARVRFVAAEPGPCRTDNGLLQLVATTGFADVTAADVLVVPGGFGTRRLVDDEPTLRWIRDLHAKTMWTTSVCTGALLLGAAGLLDGRDAATHWRARELLAKYGARPVDDRVVERGRLITCAGVSAGIDMALTLAARLADEMTARAIQLAIEYDPQPPYDSGSLASAGPAVLERLEEMTRQ